MKKIVMLVLVMSLFGSGIRAAENFVGQVFKICIGVYDPQTRQHVITEFDSLDAFKRFLSGDGFMELHARCSEMFGSGSTVVATQLNGLTGHLAALCGQVFPQQWGELANVPALCGNDGKLVTLRDYSSLGGEKLIITPNACYAIPFCLTVTIFIGGLLLLYVVYDCLSDNPFIYSGDDLDFRGFSFAKRRVRQG
ncbi:MAG: hypothetical protein H6679_02180 [Epsilonproteobacteria bacterium]|nr:hypothetical protein [Campylobacterota bacterium]